jgi:hypothetical protein
LQLQNFNFATASSVKSFSCLAFLLFFVPSFALSQEWYRSNQAGMALERIPSRMVALHHAWALSVERPGPAALPAILRPHHNSSYTLERRLLYERGVLKRRQWIFRDRGGVVRLNASLPADLSSIGKAEGSEVPPFIEFFSSGRVLTETRQILASGVYVTRYFYREEILVRAETFLDNAPLWTDSYRYTRQLLLRGVERVYHEAGAYAASLQGTSSSPPLPAVNLDLRSAPPIPGFVQPGSPHGNNIMTEVLASIYAVQAARVIYDTDNLGRVLTETRYDGNDNILAVISNEWAGDKIAVIRWSTTASPPWGTPEPA